MCVVDYWPALIALFFASMALWLTSRIHDEERFIKNRLMGIALIIVLLVLAYIGYKESDFLLT